MTFSVCEAMNSFVVGLATTALDAQVATLGTGALFLTMVLSALTLGPPVVQLLGTKMGLLTGLSLEAAYVLLFVIAARQEAGGGLQWATYLCGAACSGAGSGIAWTAQGAFFLQSAELVASPKCCARGPAAAEPAALSTSSAANAWAHQAADEPRRELQSQLLRSLTSPLPSVPLASISSPLRLWTAHQPRIPVRSLTEVGSCSSLSLGSATSLSSLPLMTMPFSAIVRQRSAARLQSRPEAHSPTASDSRSGGSGSSPHVSLAASAINEARGGGVPLVPLAAESLSAEPPSPAAAAEESTFEAALMSANSSMAGRFAATLLLMDVVVKLLFSLLQGSFLQWRFDEAILSFDGVILLFACIAVADVLVLLVVVRQPPGPPPEVDEGLEAPPQSQQCQALRGAFQLWPLPEVWCIGLTNLTFGLCSGYMNGVVNGSFAAKSPLFGKASIGALMACTSLLAAGCSLSLDALAQRVGKGLVLGLGGFCFAGIPLSVLVVQPSAANGFWGIWLLVPYVFQGLGRSVYEGTNRAVFADFFRGEQGTGAFANCMMQSGSAFFTSFLLQSTLPPGTCDRVMAYSVLAIAALTAPAYAVACCTAARRRQPPAATPEVT